MDSVSNGKLAVLQTKQWATSEEVKNLAERLLESAKRGEICSLAYVAERSDSKLESGHTRVENTFCMAGYMIQMGMRLLGFEDNRFREPL